MYTRILVPLDESKLAERALPYAILLARVFQSKIELLRVMEPSPSASISRPRSGLRVPIHGQDEQTGADYMEGVATRLREDGLTVSAMVQRGSPPSCIVSEAEKEPGTLVAMATRGRSGMARFALGSVTDKVLRSTRNPLLIIPPQEQEVPTPERELDTVIVPVDGTSLAEQVLPHVVALAKALVLTVILVRVAPSDVFTPPPHLFREQDARAVEYLHKVKEILYRQGVFVEERLLHARPEDSISDFARKTPNNLVAMTTHGRSGIGRWMLGSVTDRVVQFSGDPVLVIRGVENKTRQVN